MTYAELLRGMFPDLKPHVDDLFLLEAHQIAELPHRAPARELAAVLHAHPRIARFLAIRYPPFEHSLRQMLTNHGPAASEDLATHQHTLLWEIADWIVYQRDPAAYDKGADVNWDLAAVTELVTLDGKVVIDAGAGTGQVALAAATLARHVFAVEPVANLRRYMRQRAADLSFDNVYVLDGLLHSIPLPAGTADVLLTRQAIGWNLPKELPEIDRVVKPGGTAAHLFGADSAAALERPLIQSLVDNGYHRDSYERGQLHIHRYWKRIGR